MLDPEKRRWLVDAMDACGVRHAAKVEDETRFGEGHLHGRNKRGSVYGPRKTEE